MNNHLDDLTYDDAESAKLCGDIAAEIRRRVKKLNFDRSVQLVSCNGKLAREIAVKIFKIRLSNNI